MTETTYKERVVHMLSEHTQPPSRPNDMRRLPPMPLFKRIDQLLPSRLFAIGRVVYVAQGAKDGYGAGRRLGRWDGHAG